MDPIEVEAPDGSIVEFPAGTDDATINAAMAQAYPQQRSPQAMADRRARSTVEVDAPVDVTEEEAARQAEFDAQPGLQMDPLRPDRIAVDWPALDTSQPAHAKWAELAEAGDINPNMPLGSDQNPYVLQPGMSEKAIQELVERGVTFIDPEGRMQRKADDLYGLYVGAARPATNVMNWLNNGVDAVGDAVGAENLGEDFEGWREENMRYTTQEGMDELEGLARQIGRRPGRGGQFAGAVGATAPLILATRNPWLGGAAEGALQSNATDARGLLVDTAIGGATGGVVDATVRGVGAMVSPNVNPAARRLYEEGAELSPGQLIGGRAHAIEDATTGFPIIGDLTGSAQRVSEESLNRVAIQRPLSRIGIELPSNIGSTHNAIRFTQDAVGAAYDDLLPQLQVRLDQDFLRDFRSLDSAAHNMAPDQVAQWEALIQNEFAPRFNAAVGPANGRITGEAFKELEEILGKEIRDFAASGSPHDRRYSSAVRELQAQLRDMLGRANPQHAERLASINDAYRQLTILEDAAARAPAGARGRFSATQLDDAAARADGSMRRRASSRGDTLFQDLSEDAAELMRRQVNDSGTTSRGMVGVSIAAALSSKLPIIAVNPWAAAGLAAGSLIYTKTGNRLFTRALMERPDFAPAVREFMDRMAPGLGTIAGAQGAIMNNEADAANAEDIQNMERHQMVDDMMLQQQGGPQNTFQGPMP